MSHAPQISTSFSPSSEQCAVHKNHEASNYTLCSLLAPVSSLPVPISLHPPATKQPQSMATP